VSCLTSLSLQASSTPQAAVSLAAPKAEPAITPAQEVMTCQLLSADPDAIMQQPSALGYEVQRHIWNTVVCDKREDLCKLAAATFAMAALAACSCLPMLLHSSPAIHSRASGPA
jgi:hypothetical protein